MAQLREQRLLEAGLQAAIVSSEQVEQARLLARRQQKSLLDVLCYQVRLPLTAFYRAYADSQGLRYLESAQLKPEIPLLRRLPLSMLRQYLVLPLQQGESEVVLCACGNPEDSAMQRQVSRLLNRDVIFGVAEPVLLGQLIEHYAPLVEPGDFDTPSTTSVFDPVGELETILNQAYLYRASDIHMEPQRDRFQVRLRVDGRLRLFPRFYNLEQGAGLMSRLKVLSSLDIAETRMPQDGGMHYRISEGLAFDIRVATGPTQHGEQATLRLLGTDVSLLSLERIGMNATNLQRFRQTIESPFGMVLITGPTGSGKSTTLYAALQELVSEETNILTAEDPVEQTLPGINQLQVGVKVDFAKALRSFLRHDPDVIMVGEIRDAETANIAMKAAMTGHLVFSTLHTNTAVGSVTRLADIGVERYMIGSTLRCVIAQRLVRKLCPHCREAHTPDASLCRQLKLAADHPPRLYRPVGCVRCAGGGYSGRLPLFEILWIDATLGDRIATGASEQQILEQAEHFLSLAADGRDKLLAGETSIEELNRLGLVHAGDSEAGAMP